MSCWNPNLMQRMSPRRFCQTLGKTEYLVGQWKGVWLISFDYDKEYRVEHIQAWAGQTGIHGISYGEISFLTNRLWFFRKISLSGDAWDYLFCISCNSRSQKKSIWTQSFSWKSHKEIAVIMGISVHTVERQIYLTLTELRKTITAFAWLETTII